MTESRIATKGSALTSPTLHAFAALVFFTLLAGDVFRYSVSWYGWGAIALAQIAFCVVLLVRQRATWRISTLPYPLLAFLLLAILSLTWSQYRLGTFLGILTTIGTIIAGLTLAVIYTRDELLRALGVALRVILGLSLAFELFVSLVVRAPVLPLWVSYPQYAEDEIPKLLFWSRNELLEGGKIQGIVGNSSLLGFVALLAVIVFAIQFAAHSVSRRWSGFWLVLAVVTVYLTRSATITVALAALAITVLAVLILRTLTTSRARSLFYTGMVAIGVAAVFAVIAFSSTLLAALGKSDDLTGRTGIWEAVIQFGSHQPVFGSGWISYWIPWMPPFDTLASAAGVQQLHAHNAWLDVWMQLGYVGLAVFLLLVLGTLVRTWSLAVDRPQFGAGQPGRFSATTLLPLLVMVALIVQSLAESRLLIEYGLMFLVLWAVSTKRDTVA